MDISRKTALDILKFLASNQKFYFPFSVMNREHGLEDNDFIEIEPNEWKTINDDENYKTFQLWENLNHLYADTTSLLAKGFIDIIQAGKVKNREFIFYTAEGYTSALNKNENLEDIENLQILGWGKGSSPKNAFNMLRSKSLWLNNFCFEEVMAAELKNKNVYYFNLNNYDGK